MSKLAEQLGIDMDAFRKHSGAGGRRRPIEEAVSPEQKHLSMLQTALADAKEEASNLWSTTNTKDAKARSDREKVYHAISKLEGMVAGWKPTR